MRLWETPKQWPTHQSRHTNWTWWWRVFLCCGTRIRVYSQINKIKCVGDFIKRAFSFAKTKRRRWMNDDGDTHSYLISVQPTIRHGNEIIGRRRRERGRDIIGFVMFGIGSERDPTHSLSKSMDDRRMMFVVNRPWVKEIRRSRRRSTRTLPF